LTKGLDKPVGIAVDSSTGEVFYDEDDQAGGDTYHPLSVASIHSNSTRLVLPKLLDPQGLAIDTANRKVYYTEHHGGRVGVVDYDGKNQKVIHRWNAAGGCADGQCPSDVKVDVDAGKIFVTIEGDASDTNMIVSMNLNGTGLKTLKKNIVRAYGLTLDTKRKTIYYISGGHGGFIGNMTYDGENPSGVNVLEGLDWPYMLDFDQARDRLVFSTTGVGDGVIKTCHPNGTDVQESLTLGFAPMGVVFGKIPASQ
jgi:DNA-binding beta-propeller fold protein YncE